MGFYDDINNVQEYIRMSKGYNNNILINELKKHLKTGSTLLELGMGEGNDIDSLNEYYNVIGSDKSEVFLDLYRKKNKNIEVIKLDAVKIDINNKFDCIYSNKVLQHLTKNELKESFKNQSNVLKSDGILFHSFWYGNKQEDYNGLLFSYYNENTIKQEYSKYFTLIKFGLYSEMEEKDSFFIILKKINNKDYRK